MNEIEQILLWCKVAIQLEGLATRGPWYVEAPACPKSPLQVNAEEPWRRRPSGNAYREFNDVAAMAGGQSDTAKANANFIAFAREAMPRMAVMLFRLLGGKPDITKDEIALLCDMSGVPNRPPTADEAEAFKGVKAKASLRSHEDAFVLANFLDRLADAFDYLFGAMGGEVAGFPVSDRNAGGWDRLLMGGARARGLRARMLKVIEELLNPEQDYWRAQKLSPSSRLHQNGRPKVTDLMRKLPSEVRERLHEVYVERFETPLLDAPAASEQSPNP